MGNRKEVRATFVKERVLIYTVKSRDSLRSILRRFKTPVDYDTNQFHLLDGTGWEHDDSQIFVRCRKDLTVDKLWNLNFNRQGGFVADPNKNRYPFLDSLNGEKKIANDPDYIYPGEYVAIPVYVGLKERPEAYNFLFRPRKKESPDRPGPRNEQ